MSNPTPEAITLIKDYVNTNVPSGFSLSNIELVATLNDPSYTGNPTLPRMVYGSFQAPDMLALISISSVKNVIDSPGTAVSLIPLLNELPHTTSNIFFLNSWAQAYEATSIITAQEYASITGLINTLVLDSTYATGISFAQASLGRSVDIDDIQSCR